MKQEHESPPLSSSPPTLSSSPICSLRRPSSPQEASVCLQVSVVSSVQVEQGEHEEEDNDNRDVGRVKSESGGVVEVKAQENKDGSTKGHKLQPADSRLLPTSSLHRSVLSPFASVNFLCLEGVTELESGTDWDCSTQGPHCDVVMRETWETLETLCELGAFLQQVSVGGACKARCAEQGFGLSATTAQKRGSSIQRRVSEVEARLRQAGLTPPSLMKRSASLAKLGCLELLANDLSEWELSRSSVAPSFAEPPIHAVNDESKKQRVQNSPSAGQLPDVHGTSAESQSEAGRTSPPPQITLSSIQPNSDIDSLHFPGPTLKTTKQQYGRTHPLRRLKKRTTSTLYHTM